MAENERASILYRIRRLTAEGVGVSDAQLLDRFTADRDEAAFELLLWRHARLVYGVCLRVLRNPDDAEDAFQATFLALARHAGRITRREAVASWLHKVAYRVALTARRQQARHGVREKTVDTVDPVSDAPAAETLAENHELQAILDQEIGLLPVRYRAPVVLCYLEGKSVDEAAMLLGCPRGTVASRLARARERLRVRLTRRGLAVTAGLALLGQANAAPRPVSLIATLTAAAVRFSAEGGVTDGVASPRITALTEEVLRAMFMHKLKTGIVVVIALVGLLLAGSGLALALQMKADPTSQPQHRGEIVQAKAAKDAKKAEDKPVDRGARAVTVSRPVRRESAPYKDYTGRLTAHRTVEVRPAVSGFVVKVSFKAGARVKKGDVLFLLDPRAAELTMDKAKAELELAAAKKKQADADHNRAQALLRAGGLPQEQLDQVTQRAETATAAVKLARIGVARAQLDLEATRVTAPMDGQVGRPLVDAGTLVFRGQDRATLLTTITSSNPIELTFELDEYSFLEYQRLVRKKEVKGVGSSLRMHVAGDNKDFPHEGTLENVADQFNPQTGTVRVQGIFPNPDQRLLPGMFARVRMMFGVPRNVLEIPESAILTDRSKTYVLVIDTEDVVARRDVTLGWVDHDMHVVEKGLSTDDWVVTDGLAKLRPGQKVEPRKKPEPKR